MPCLTHNAIHMVFLLKSDCLLFFVLVILLLTFWCDTSNCIWRWFKSDHLMNILTALWQYFTRFINKFSFASSLICWSPCLHLRLLTVFYRARATFRGLSIASTHLVYLLWMVPILIEHGSQVGELWYISISVLLTIKSHLPTRLLLIIMNIVLLVLIFKPVWLKTADVFHFVH